MKNIVLVLFALSICLPVIAQERVSGKVMDENGMPQEYVNVVCLALPDSTFVDGTVTDQSGSFSIVCKQSADLLKVSSVGFTTLYRPIGSPDMGVLTIASDAQLLNEVVVKGDLPQTRLKGDAMVTNIQGTVLAKAGTAENLLDKIPGLSASEGSVKVFGRGDAVVYINGRLMRDASELDRLSSDNIKSVEVISNPGAKYDASVNAVVRITTQKNEGEGLGIDNRTVAKYQSKWTLSEQVNLNYRKGNASYRGMLFGNDGRRVIDSDLRQDTYLDKHWQQNMKIGAKQHYQMLSGALGMDYSLPNSGLIGGAYQWNRTPTYTTQSNLLTDVLQDGQLSEKTSGVMDTYLQNTDHNLNVYYTGKTGKWDIDLNVDGMWSSNGTGTHVNEIGIVGAEDRVVKDHTDADNSLYAAKLVLSREWLKGEVSLGVEYIYVQRSNDYQNESGIIDNALSDIDEQTTAVFAEYTRTFGKINMQAGLRYEHVGFDYYENSVRSDEQSKTFDNLFPSLALSTSFDKLQMQVSYATDIARPSYYQLRGNLQYNNRYTYEGGNPLLKPSLSHNAQLTLSYKWLTLTGRYQYKEDAFVWDSRPYSEEDPSIAVLTQQNAPAYNNMMLMLTASRRLGSWSPTFNAGFQKQWYGLDTPEGYRHLNMPRWLLEWNNDVELPAGFLLTAKVAYASRSDYQNISNLRNDWNMQLVVYKAFLKDRLSLQLYANDIFNSSRSESTTYFGALRTMWRYIAPNSRSVSLTVRYKFNSAKSKYKGTSAGASQKDRM